MPSLGGEILCNHEVGVIQHMTCAQIRRGSIISVEREYKGYERNLLSLLDLVLKCMSIESLVLCYSTAGSQLTVQYVFVSYPSSCTTRHLMDHIYDRICVW